MRNRVAQTRQRFAEKILLSCIAPHNGHLIFMFRYALSKNYLVGPGI